MIKVAVGKKIVSRLLLYLVNSAVVRITDFVVVSFVSETPTIIVSFIVVLNA